MNCFHHMRSRSSFRLPLHLGIVLLGRGRRGQSPCLRMFLPRKREDPYIVQDLGSRSNNIVQFLPCRIPSAGRTNMQRYSFRFYLYCHTSASTTQHRGRKQRVVAHTLYTVYSIHPLLHCQFGSCLCKILLDKKNTCPGLSPCNRF